MSLVFKTRALPLGQLSLLHPYCVMQLTVFSYLSLTSKAEDRGIEPLPDFTLDHPLAGEYHARLGQSSN